VPFKFNYKGRHHIPRQRHRVTNWRDYDAALRNRGSLTIWFTEEALAGWKAQPRTTPGGQRHYSDLAIETALTLRAVFRLALRQSEGLIGSIMRMLDIDLPVPDHTTLSRRASGLPVHGHGRNGTDELHLIGKRRLFPILLRGLSTVEDLRFSALLRQIERSRGNGTIERNTGGERRCR
jgi:hypothetical protein